MLNIFFSDMAAAQNKKTRAEAPVKALDPAGETGRSSEGERWARISGGLLGLEVIEQALHGVHAGLFDRALSDLADRREWHAGFTRDGALRDLLFSKLRHDHLVKIDWVFHG